MHLKLICLFVIVTVMAASAAEEEKAKKITKLQIGVKKRVPEDECDMKSRHDKTNLCTIHFMVYITCALQEWRHAAHALHGHPV